MGSLEKRVAMLEEAKGKAVDGHRLLIRFKSTQHPDRVLRSIEVGDEIVHRDADESEDDFVGRAHTMNLRRFGGGLSVLMEHVTG